MKRILGPNLTQPALIGVTLGLLAGLCRVMPALIAAGYLNHRMYCAGLHMIVTSINLYVLMVCVASYALYAGLVYRGWLRLICFLFVGIICLRVAAVSFDWSKWFRTIFQGIDTSVFVRDIITQGLLPMIASICCIALGVLVIRRMRRGHRIDVERGDVSAPGIPSWSPSFRITRAYQRSIPFLAGIVLVILGLNLTFTVFSAKNAHDARRSPNIIYIMVDTLRADHLGCYGYFRNTSPNIDNFARSSIRFSRAISQAPWTTASIASFMSSRYLNISMENYAPPTNVVLMPELLRERGYTTGAVISNPLAGAYAHLDRGYDHYFERNYRGMPGFESKQRIPSDMLSKSLEMIRQVKDQRFFMFIHFMGPHGPYAAHAEYNFYPDYHGKLDRKSIVPWSLDAKGDDLKYAIAMYDGEIAYTDHYVGLLFSELKKLHLYDDTLIVFLADHGEEFKEHGEMSHGLHLFDETISVPLIIKLPKQNEGRIVEGAFPLVDLLPSVTSYIHCDTSALEFQGAAVPLSGLRRVRQADIYSSTDYENADLECVRGENSKLIVDNNRQKKQLYDLRRDPGEQRNIAKDMPDMTAALQSELSKRDFDIKSALRSAVNPDRRISPNKDTQESLRSLGYLQ